MGISIGGHDKRSRNLDLNLVPMIDLMSCMTAFLLVTAVWQDMGTLDAEPHTKGAGQIKPTAENDVYSVLIRPDRILLADRRTHEVQGFATPADFRAGLAALYAQSPAPAAAEIEIAGDSTDDAPVAYQALVDAMSIARATGIAHIDVVDPRALTTVPVDPGE